jgi:hypothetical protein
MPNIVELRAALELFLYPVANETTSQKESRKHNALMKLVNLYQQCVNELEQPNFFVDSKEAAALLSDALKNFIPKNLDSVALTNFLSTMRGWAHFSRYQKCKKSRFFDCACQSLKTAAELGNIDALNETERTLRKIFDNRSFPEDPLGQLRWFFIFNAAINLIPRLDNPIHKRSCLKLLICILDELPLIKSRFEKLLHSLTHNDELKNHLSESKYEIEKLQQFLTTLPDTHLRIFKLGVKFLDTVEWEKDSSCDYFDFEYRILLEKVLYNLDDQAIYEKLPAAEKRRLIKLACIVVSSAHKENNYSLALLDQYNFVLLFAMRYLLADGINREIVSGNDVQLLSNFSRDLANFEVTENSPENQRNAALLYCELGNIFEIQVIQKLNHFIKIKTMPNEPQQLEIAYWLHEAKAYQTLNLKALQQAKQGFGEKNRQNLEIREEKAKEAITRVEKLALAAKTGIYADFISTKAIDVYESEACCPAFG